MGPALVSVLKKSRSAPSTKEVEACPHLRRVLTDESDERTLLRKADEQKRALF